ncbi:MAG: hypothetical protein NVSMB46_03500 [Candidatus Saccharimonadales bacterium]
MDNPETLPSNENAQPNKGYIENTFKGPKLDLSEMSKEERDAALMS